MRLKNISLPYSIQIFKALSEEARVRIINLLANNKEMCISDLELVLGFTQTKTSRHLTFLKNAGIVNSKRVDKWIFYYIKEEASEILRQIFVFIQKDPQLIKDQEIFKVLYSNRELALNQIETRKWQGD
ncbi:ArsR/SmtB family transcription factor [Peijinzhouia sedimentorum]|tara:strand:+ start:85 stop:471 length:387 start_codon:yes stop_codon:yes gene_type:complete